MECEATTLGDLCSRGGQYGIAAPAVDFDSNLPTYLRISDISDDGTLSSSERKSVDDPAAWRYMLNEGDIVFARTGASAGRNYFFDPRDGSFAYAGFLIRFSLDSQKVNPRYVKYYVQTKAYWDWVESFNAGSTRGNINAKTYASMPIRLPSRGTQDFIVSICDALTNKIRINREANRHLTAMLVDLQKRISESSDMKECRADELFSIHIGKTPPRKQHEWFSSERTGNTIWMSIKDMGVSDVHLIDSSEYLTKKAVEQFNIKVCKPGSVLLSFKLTVGRVGIVAKEMVTNEAIACFSSDNMSRLSYLYPLLLGYDYSMLGNTSSIATAVNSKTIKAMPLRMPSDSALEKYYQLTRPIYELLLSNTMESVNLQIIKDELLPKLISGEIGIPEAKTLVRS